jgi:hypothetical protein
MPAFTITHGNWIPPSPTNLGSSPAIQPAQQSQFVLVPRAADVKLFVRASIELLSQTVVGNQCCVTPVIGTVLSQATPVIHAGTSPASSTDAALSLASQIAGSLEEC